MDPQKIIDTCEGCWDANQADCNAFVRSVCEDLGVTLFVPGDNADAIVDKLSHAADWTELDDGVAAKHSADAGTLVIGGLKSGEHDPPREHGHVVIVVKGPIDAAHNKYPTAYWGSLGGIGKKNSTVNFAWNAADRDKVHYFSRRAADVGDRITTAGVSDVGTTQEAVQRLIEGAVHAVSEAARGDADKERLFFPNGIDLIDVEVKAAGVEVKIKIAGPKAQA